MVKIDYGILYEGYCSDLTRTYILDKFFNNVDVEELLKHLINAQHEAVKILKPGIKCSSVYNASNEYLKKQGLDNYFTHGLGHGVGIEIHERPYLRKDSSEILKEGMVVTVEPGIYMTGIGGMRVEDTYLINKEGAEQLTRIYQ
jgi:Xaa-Pro aminopeptidase